jgi:pyruvate,water dikinase
MLTLPLSSTGASLENSGGKGASLARLARLGLPVPPGFIVTTQAYCRFVQANGLEPVIASALEAHLGDDVARLEAASRRIRGAFSASAMPEEIAAAVRQEYRLMDGGSSAVAVRSSATAEDLPDLSFAGQQDTFLNVMGEEQLCSSLVSCWSSLWTARAIGYRERNLIPHEGAALAVVVQRMVESEVSGVLFTANPLTGLLSEAVIDATFGLGEALVSGQVEPDHFVIDSLSGELRSVRLGEKATSTRARSGGGVESVSEEAATRQTLAEEQLRLLAEAGRQIQQAYESPQDIEWAFAGGQLYILQSRPITSLFPVPRVSFDPLVVWFSFGAFQGIVGPMTPLGQEAVARVALGLGNKLGAHLSYEAQDVFGMAGERIWVNVSGLIRNPLGKRVMMGFLGIGEPGSAMILQKLMADPRLEAGKGRFRLSSLRRLLEFAGRALPEIPRSLARPEQARARFDAKLDAYLRTVQIRGGSDRFERLKNFAAYMSGQGALAEAMPVLLPSFMPIMGPSLALLKLIDELLPQDSAGQDGLSAMDITRALPRNVTTEMDLELWRIATLIKSDAESAEAFANGEPEVLARRYLEGKLPGAAQSAQSGFMDRYGMRGAGEIDLGQPRWCEDPTAIIETLRSYLQISEQASPALLFERNARAAEQSLERMAAIVRKTRAGWLKEKLLRAAARRVRLLLGARESPKFYAVRAMWVARKTLLEIGEEFVAAGTVLRREDMFFLHVNELEAMAGGEDRDWKALVAARREAYAREARRRQVPRVLVSDGRAFYEGVGAESDTADSITGSPVSAGVVEGVVHVVFDPGSARLAPGEILVCRGTDPAWTPLFMAAGGLVMEVGGMMTHGSVVAREYGIPAVVGVHEATLRLKDGQRIRLDGTRGRIVFLDKSDG